MCGERAPETEEIGVAARGVGEQGRLLRSAIEKMASAPGRCRVATFGVLGRVAGGLFQHFSCLIRRGVGLEIVPVCLDCPGMLSFRWDIGDAEGRGNSGGVLNVGGVLSGFEFPNVPNGGGV